MFKNIEVVVAVKKFIGLIFAQSLNGAIGYKNSLLWHIPEDLKYFKQKTIGFSVIMGLNTFKSIGAKPLCGRQNIVLTHNKARNIDGVEFASSLKEAVNAAKKDIWIIGGASVYRQALETLKIDEIDRTIINVSCETFDAEAPKINPAEFHLESSRAQTSGNGISFIQGTYKRFG